MRKRALVVALAAVMLVGAALPAVATGNGPRTLTYEVTVHNLTATQWFTPPLAATHHRSVDIFEPGHAASAELAQLAENGDLGPLVGVLEASRRVADVVVTVASADLPPVAPGGSVTFEISATSQTRLLSIVSMLVCTNDGFAGIDSIRLPRVNGGTVDAYGYAWDAGSEINTEDFADIVPPCQALNGVSSDDEGSGMSDPALAEHGVVSMHGGVMGGDDLTHAAHGWNTSAPAVKISVTRTG